ncbi:MAG: TIGR01212 family radical SAM protein [Candidatus Omnitrophica bacterium]|nr:TIGR01212 family radical SAM protein [Candidatus Omnitrophota bacterium]
MEKYFYSFNDYLQKMFKTRVQRLSLNAGFTCPTRDGKIDTEGCIYCNEKGFSSLVGTRLSLEKQAENAIDYARKRYKAEKFIAYFQNATNTYATYSKLKTTYDIIRCFPDIVGLYFSTRPDCIDGKKLDLIESYSEDYDVWVEYGLQSAHDSTLKFINRRHTFHDFVEAATITAKKKIKVGAHVILGLPGETREDMLETAEKIADLPVSGIKLHVLHVLKGTKLEKYYNRGKVDLLTFNEYINTACDFLEVTNPGCVIFRLVSDANPDFLIAPKWINRKSEVINAIKKEFEKRHTKQGSLWHTTKK